MKFLPKAGTPRSQPYPPDYDIPVFSAHQPVLPFLVFWGEFLFFFLGIHLPPTGQNSHNREKRVSESKKNISYSPRKGRSKSKNPHFPWSALYRNGDFFDSEHPFLGWQKMGVFDSETLFSRFGRFWTLPGANGFLSFFFPCEEFVFLSFFSLLWGSVVVLLVVFPRGRTGFSLFSRQEGAQAGPESFESV